PMQRHRQLDDAETGAEMAAGDGHRVDGFLAQFVRQLAELLFRQATQVIGGDDLVEQRALGGSVHADCQPFNDAPCRRPSGGGRNAHPLHASYARLPLAHNIGESKPLRPIWGACTRDASPQPSAVAGRSLPNRRGAQRAWLLPRFERLGPHRDAGVGKGQPLDFGLGLLQEAIAMLFERLTALVDGDAFLEFDVAALEAADDALELLERPLKAHAGNIDVLGRGLAGLHRLLMCSGQGCEATHAPTFINVLTCTLTDLASAVRL